MEVLSIEQMSTRRKGYVKPLADITKQPHAPYIQIPEFTPDPRYDHAYGRLAEGLFIGFYNKALQTGNQRYIDLAKKPNVLSGIYAMTKIMSYGPSAYADYATKSGKEPNLSELTEIMARSASVTKPFAHAPQKANTVLEINFGLRQYATPSLKPPFIVEDGIAEPAAFKPSPAVMATVTMELMPRMLSGEIPESGRGEVHCPAVGMVMNSLWLAGVETAAKNPELFAAGLQEA